jgi:hypothetical protein
MSLDSWEIRMCIPAKRGHPINKAGGWKKMRIPRIRIARMVG